MAKRILPSVLYLLNKNLPNESFFEQFKKNKIDLVHYDVMDGKFVPQCALTDQYFDSFVKHNLKINVHLMVLDPTTYLTYYFNHADIVQSIVFHVEPLNIDQIKKFLLMIHHHKIQVGVAFKYETDVKKYQEILPLCDLITIMSVCPGKCGQKFDPACENNISYLNSFKRKNSLHYLLQLDGGVDDTIIKRYKDDVDDLISSSYLFNNIDKLPDILKLVK